MVSFEEHGKKLTKGTTVKIEDHEPDITKNYTCKAGRIVDKNDIQSEIPNPLIMEVMDKLAKLMGLYEEKGNKPTKDIFVQTNAQELEQKKVEEKVLKVETPNPLMKATKDKLAM